MFSVSLLIDLAGNWGTGLKLFLTKSAAAFKALNGSDADILVSPQYVVEVSNQIWQKTIRVTVTGYGGKIDRIN